MDKVTIIADIGINHNGDIKIVKKLIKIAKDAGVDIVKFQKRTIEEVYSPEELDIPRESPFGKTNREQKIGLELRQNDYNEINSFCNYLGIDWTASAWDIKSQKFLQQYNLKYNKVASAMLTCLPLLEEIAKEGKYTFISTGMSTYDEIDIAIDIFKKYDCPYELMHCVSTYPMKDEDANLCMINILNNKYCCNVGYSGHEVGLQITLAAVAMGATSIERHITLDRTMYGSDQAASLEPNGLRQLVRDIRIIENAIGDGIKLILDKEQECKNKLANPYWIKKGRK